MQTCPACGTHVAPALLSCPSCQRLVHAEQLTQLAQEARRAEQAGDVSAAIAAWRRALELLPPASKQHEQIRSTIEALTRRLESGTSVSSTVGQTTRWSRNGRQFTIAGAIALLLTKGKLLLIGLTKMSTLWSLLLSFGVYWTAWGWKFALGLVLCIYIHEMGHVAMLRRYGIAASAPMFIPGFGAFVRMQQPPLNPREDAQVGLAGPWWGLAAAAIAYGVFRATGWATWAAIAHVGGWLTIFNLMPIWQLDGSRGFHALARQQRWIIVAIVLVLWWGTREGLLILFALIAGFRALGTDAPRDSDPSAFTQYVSLLLLSLLLASIHVPVPN